MGRRILLLTCIIAFACCKHKQVICGGGTIDQTYPTEKEKWKKKLTLADTTKAFIVGNVYDDKQLPVGLMDIKMIENYKDTIKFMTDLDYGMFSREIIPGKYSIFLSLQYPFSFHADTVINIDIGTITGVKISLNSTTGKISNLEVKPRYKIKDL